MQVAAFKLRSGEKMKVPPTSTDEKQKFNKNILCLMRKRGGDLFQGWLVKNLLRTSLAINNVKVCMDTDAGRANLYAREGEPGYCESININDVNAPWNIDGKINVIHDTGDYPHLAWCLENGLNILFGASNTKNFFYFEREI